MDFQALQDKFINFIYSDTELFIWISVAVLVFIIIIAGIYSASFRREIIIIAIFAGIILWLANKYYFSTL